jgi:RND family efflux transporter MFP subunit
VLRARTSSLIASRVLAPIADIRVRPGDRVVRGQVLAVLDGREFQANADRAVAARAAALQSVRAAQADKEAADASLALAKASHDRIQALHARRSATPQELDESVAALRAATARVAGAEAHAGEAAAASTSAEAAANAAAIAVSYATIVAPFDGVVSARAADPGTMATPGAPLITLEDTSAYRLEVLLDEARARQTTVGQAAEIRVDDSSSHRWTEGRIAEISRIDPASHGFVVKVDVPGSGNLRTGAFGRARFSGAPRSAIAVPASAIVYRGQLAFVFLVDVDRLARLRPVSIGQTAGDRVEVLAGLKAGDEIVANPPASLADGTRIGTARPTAAGEQR